MRFRFRSVKFKSQIKGGNQHFGDTKSFCEWPVSNIQMLSAVMQRSCSGSIHVLLLSPCVTSAVVTLIEVHKLLLIVFITLHFLFCRNSVLIISLETLPYMYKYRIFSEFCYSLFKTCASLLAVQPAYLVKSGQGKIRKLNNTN